MHHIRGKLFVLKSTASANKTFKGLDITIRKDVKYIVYICQENSSSDMTLIVVMYAAIISLGCGCCYYGVG